MEFTFAHNNFNVLDLERSLKFYREALGLDVVREINAPDGSFKLVFLGYPGQRHQIELTWLSDREEPYDLGDNEFHLAFHTPDYRDAFQKHSQMGCVRDVNEAMGLYFISDPDGYLLEIIPER